MERVGCSLGLRAAQNHAARRPVGELGSQLFVEPDQRGRRERPAVLDLDWLDPPECSVRAKEVGPAPISRRQRKGEIGTSREGREPGELALDAVGGEGVAGPLQESAYQT